MSLGESGTPGDADEGVDRPVLVAPIVSVGRVGTDVVLHPVSIATGAIFQ